MLNEQAIIGYLGKDPELKMTPGGKAMCVINVAATEKWTNQDGSKGEHTEWFRCIFWGPQAENAEKFLHKGSLVYVKGSTKTRKYNNNDGVEQKITEVQGQIFRALRDPGTGGGQSSNSGGGKKQDDPDPAGYQAPSGGGGYDDDIPFN